MSRFPSLKNKFPFIDSLLKGVGQIMLQENSLTGLLFLIGIFYGSPLMGMGVLLAVVSGTLTAKVLKYDQQETSQGLYGFSAALVGAALTLFYNPVFWIWVLIIAGSVIATVLQHFFIIKKIPVFTLPFVLVTWLIMFVINHVYPLEPSLLLKVNPIILSNFLFPFHGYGQVIFQSSLFSGIIFFIAVLIHSPLAAIFGFTGAIVAGLISAFLPIPADAISLGLWSYNAVLCAIVFTGKKIADIVWMIIAALLSVAIYFFMTIQDFVPLTFPFVAATILTLMIKKFTETKLKKIVAN